MIEHIVVFKVKADLTDAQKNDMLSAIRSLKDRVPGILDLQVGENFSERAQGFTHALVVRFTDRAALDGYIPHPAHQDVVQNHFLSYLDPDTPRIVLDFEI
jgi:hypothetical protein